MWLWIVFLCVALQPELHDAAEKGDVAEVNRLIAAGGDVNEKDDVSGNFLPALLHTYSSGSLTTAPSP